MTKIAQALTHIFDRHRNIFGLANQFHQYRTCKTFDVTFLRVGTSSEAS